MIPSLPLVPASAHAAAGPRWRALHASLLQFSWRVASCGAELGSCRGNSRFCTPSRAGSCPAARCLQVEPGGDPQTPTPPSPLFVR